MKIVWTEDGERDLDRILFYHESIGAQESGLQAVEQIFKKCFLLTSFPFLGMALEKTEAAHFQYRKIVAEKYVIYYTVEDDQVVIAAVIDGRKDPQDLENRLK
jgi:plasmid stabilization system protein ParE